MSTANLPELGFSTDPAVLKAELASALERLLYIRRLILAAQGQPEPADGELNDES